MKHFARDREAGYFCQWFGPLGIGANRLAVRDEAEKVLARLWVPSLSWVWGYWRG